MIKVKKILSVIIASALFVGVLGGCAKKEESSSNGETLKVRYAAYQGMTAVGFWFGVEKGFFKDAGIDLELVDVKDKVSAIASDSIDMGDLNTSQAITAANTGAPLKLVSSMFRTKGAWYLIGKTSIKDIKDLKGKRVGVNEKGSGMDVTVREILQQNGLDPDKDVELIANGSMQQAYASLEANQVDATIIHQPFVAMGEIEGKAKLLAKGWDYVPNFNTGALVASDKFIKSNPETVKKVIEVYFKSNEYAKEHQDEFLEFATKYLNIPKDTLVKALEPERELWENEPNINIETLKTTQELQKKWGFQKEIYDVDKIVDLSFIPQK
jgi:NitT/TauT family transport system substrate-binding protein